MYSFISSLLSVSLYGLYLLADCILLWIFSLLQFWALNKGPCTCQSKLQLQPFLFILRENLTKLSRTALNLGSPISASQVARTSITGLCHQTAFCSTSALAVYIYLTTWLQCVSLKSEPVLASPPFSLGALHIVLSMYLLRKCKHRKLLSAPQLYALEKGKMSFHVPHTTQQHLVHITTSRNIC